MIGSLILFSLLIAWAYWMNGARPAKVNRAGGGAGG